MHMLDGKGHGHPPLGAGGRWRPIGAWQLQPANSTAGNHGQEFDGLSSSP
jgi:hypothetical protein